MLIISPEKPPRHLNNLTYRRSVKLYLSIALIAVGTLTSCLEKNKEAISDSGSETTTTTAPAASAKVAPENTAKVISGSTSATSDFDSFIASPGTINIVDFSATWCPPCQQLKPVLYKIAEEKSSKVKLKVIDVDQHQQLAAQHGVSGIPDVRFFVNGKQVDKFSGAAPKEHIEQMISDILTKHAKQLSAGANAAPDAAPDAVAPPHPELVPTPASPPTQSPNSTTPATPTTPAEPTIKPSKGNQLPPGMSKG
jgi:thioredoxin